MKVSFDFDSTLTRPCIQKFAQSLVTSGYEVHITTSRCFSGYGMIYDNSDLFIVADKVGIKRDNITFTQGNFKTGYLDSEFLFHLDDDKYEIDRIKHIPCVNVKHKFSIRKCREILENE